MSLSRIGFMRWDLWDMDFSSLFCCCSSDQTQAVKEPGVESSLMRQNKNTGDLDLQKVTMEVKNAQERINKAKKPDGYFDNNYSFYYDGKYMQI